MHRQMNHKIEQTSEMQWMVVFGGIKDTILYVLLVLGG